MAAAARACGVKASACGFGGGGGVVPCGCEGAGEDGSGVMGVVALRRNSEILSL
jgi:hypothetical protein